MNRNILISTVIIILAVVTASVFISSNRNTDETIWISRPESQSSFDRIRQINPLDADRKMLTGKDYYDLMNPERGNGLHIPNFEFYVLEELGGEPGKLYSVALDKKNTVLVLKGGGLTIDDYQLRFNRLIDKSLFNLKINDQDATDSYVDFQLQMIFQADFMTARGGEIFMNPEDNSLTAEMDPLRVIIPFKDQKNFKKYRKLFEEEGIVKGKRDVTYNLIVKPRDSAEDEIYHLSLKSDLLGRIELQMNKIEP